MLKKFNKKNHHFLVIFFSNYLVVSNYFCNFALSKRKNKKLKIKRNRIMSENNYLFGQWKPSVDGKVRFNEDDWVCTDPDEIQFCRKVNNHTFEYIQLKKESLLLIKDNLRIGKQVLKFLDGVTDADDWYEEIIDVDNYTDEEIKEYIAPYGGILDGVTDQTYINQLIAECIFEQDVVFVGEYFSGK